MDKHKQHPNSPLDAIASDCIAARLRLLNRVITNLYDSELRPLSLKVSQMNILVLASRHGLAQPAAVCKTLQIDQSTLSRNVERMCARGWLAVVPHQDGRAHPFRITRQGQRLIKKAYPGWSRAQRKAVALIGDTGVKFLDNVIRKVQSGERDTQRTDD